jgi:hypothetical protein
VCLTFKGQEEFTFDEATLMSIAKEKKPQLEHALRYLEKTFPEARYHQIKDTKFASDLLQVERKHPQDFAKQLKVSIIYSKSGQKDLTEMFSNSKMSVNENS